ncbi:MAG: alpha/beta hydrolase fold domain-containing protein [Acidimicrobiales bacterium]
MFIERYNPVLEEFVEEARAFNEKFNAQLPAGPFDLSTPEGLARARNISAFDSLKPADSAGAAEDRVVRVDKRSVPVRIIVPSTTPRAVYLDIHGGGFFLGAAAMGDTANTQLADELDVAVVSVDYRLAPAHPWPAAPDDCETAALWVLERAMSEFGADRVFIGGGSAGAHLAAVTLLRMRDRHDAASRFIAADLVFGLYDLSGTSPSGRILAPTSKFYIDAYLRRVPKTKRLGPDVSPLFADLHGMPPALFTVGTLDAFYEDNLAMAMRWLAAGNLAELAVYPESPHAFTVFPTAMAHAANRRQLEWLADQLAL